jgi:hypothetical protein
MINSVWQKTHNPRTHNYITVHAQPNVQNKIIKKTTKNKKIVVFVGKSMYFCAQKKETFSEQKI